jgi:hypothetical protein
MALGIIESLTEMSTTNLPGGKLLARRKTDNITAIYEAII